MNHGAITRQGDEFNNDDMAYCAYCGASHTVSYKGCDGLRRPPPAAPLVATPEGDKGPALAHQEGGGHYKGMAIQPVEFIHANGIGYFEGNVIKYVSRWRAKGGVEDLRKARHYIDLLIDLEGGTVQSAQTDRAQP